MKLGSYFLLGAAAGISYLGYVQCRETLERPAPSTLKPSQLEELKDPDPVWVRLEGSFVPLYPLVRTAESGGDKATWLPIATPEEPGKAVCVLELESPVEADDISSHQRRELFKPIAGLARLPSGKDEKDKLELLAASGRVSVAPGCRVLAVGSKPWALPLSLGLLGFGAVGALATVLCSGPRRAAASRPSGTSASWEDLPVSPAVKHAIARAVAQALERSPALSGSRSIRQSAPLPPEVKDEVAQMIADAWDRAA